MNKYKIFGAAAVTIFLTSVPLFHARAEVGPGSLGGGGGAIICLDQNQDVTSAALVDLVEGEFYEQYQLSHDFKGKPWLDQLLLAARRISFVDPYFARSLQENIKVVLGDMPTALLSTEGTDQVFPTPQDLSKGRVPPVNLGCQVVGAAVYADKTKTNNHLTISNLVWSHLNETNKAALLLHEALYLHYRQESARLELNAGDSSAARAVVGFAFSDRLDGESDLISERKRFQVAGHFRPFSSAAIADKYELARIDEIRQIFAALMPSAADARFADNLFLDSSTCATPLTVVARDPYTPFLFSHCALNVRSAEDHFPGQPAKNSTLVQPISTLPGLFFLGNALHEFGTALPVDEDLRLSCQVATASTPHSTAQMQFRCGDLVQAELDAVNGDFLGVRALNKSNFYESFLKNLQMPKIHQILQAGADADFEFIEVARSVAGSPLLLTEKQARQYCIDHQARIPTAREWAQYAVKGLATKIKETRFPDTATNDTNVLLEIDQMAKSGYAPVRKMGPADRSVIDFYYPEQFTSSASWPSDLWFWSSSVDPWGPDDPIVFHQGHIRWAHSGVRPEKRRQDALFATACVRDRGL